MCAGITPSAGHTHTHHDHLVPALHFNVTQTKTTKHYRILPLISDLQKYIISHLKCPTCVCVCVEVEIFYPVPSDP